MKTFDYTIHSPSKAMISELNLNQKIAIWTNQMIDRFNMIGRPATEPIHQSTRLSPRTQISSQYRYLPVAVAS